MNKKQAIQAMLRCQRITHVYFGRDEWMTMPNRFIIEFEDGVTMSTKDFWNDRKGDGWGSGYSIWKPIF